VNWTGNVFFLLVDGLCWWAEQACLFKGSNSLFFIFIFYEFTKIYSIFNFAKLYLYPTPVSNSGKDSHPRAVGISQKIICVWVRMEINFVWEL
jgi:hypothetical protein